jgi:hypothetical protein
MSLDGAVEYYNHLVKELAFILSRLEQPKVGLCRLLNSQQPRWGWGVGREVRSHVCVFGACAASCEWVGGGGRRGGSGGACKALACNKQLHDISSAQQQLAACLHVIFVYRGL